MALVRRSASWLARLASASSRRSYATAADLSCQAVASKAGRGFGPRTIQCWPDLGFCKQQFAHKLLTEDVAKARAREPSRPAHSVLGLAWAAAMTSCGVIGHPTCSLRALASQSSSDVLNVLLVSVLGVQTCDCRPGGSAYSGPVSRNRKYDRPARPGKQLFGQSPARQAASFQIERRRLAPGAQSPLAQELRIRCTPFERLPRCSPCGAGEPSAHAPHAAAGSCGMALSAAHRAG